MNISSNKPFLGTTDRVLPLFCDKKSKFLHKKILPINIFMLGHLKVNANICKTVKMKMSYAVSATSDPSLREEGETNWIK